MEQKTCCCYSSSVNAASTAARPGYLLVLPQALSGARCYEPQMRNCEHLGKIEIDCLSGQRGAGADGHASAQRGDAAEDLPGGRFHLNKLQAAHE